MNRGSAWTSEMENTLTSLLESNLSIEEIAGIMGRTNSSILSRLNIINKRKLSSQINEIFQAQQNNETSASASSSSEELQPVLHIGQSVIASPSAPKQVNFDSIIERIRGKKVLILDLETTGLVKDRANFYKYWDNKVYDECRIVEIGYWYSPSFDPNMDSLKINNYLRKPTDFFEIPEGAVAVHGISFEKATNEGFTFNKIMVNNRDNLNNPCLSLYQILNTMDVFISHNTAFDFYVLLNELCRIKQYGTIKKMMQIKKNKDVICTCKHSGYKRLGNIYKSIFNCDVDVAHRAGDDVRTLIEILVKKRFNNSTEYITQIHN